MANIVKFPPVTKSTPLPGSDSIEYILVEDGLVMDTHFAEGAMAALSYFRRTNPGHHGYVYIKVGGQ